MRYSPVQLAIAMCSSAIQHGRFASTHAQQNEGSTMRTACGAHSGTWGGEASQMVLVLETMNDRARKHQVHE